MNDRSILVVEDDALIQWDIAQALASAGYTSIRTASSRREARLELAKSKPHLGILDIKLGVSTSVPLADRLADSRVPFLFLSAYSPKFLPERHKDRPFVSKPFHHDDLLAQVHAMLNKSKTAITATAVASLAAR